MCAGLTVAFHVCFRNDGSTCIDRCQNEERQGDIFYLRRLYSTHPSNPEMKRMLAFITGMLNLRSVHPDFLINLVFVNAEGLIMQFIHIQ